MSKAKQAGALMTLTVGVFLVSMGVCRMVQKPAVTQIQAAPIRTSMSMTTDLAPIVPAVGPGAFELAPVMVVGQVYLAPGASSLP